MTRTDGHTGAAIPDDDPSVAARGLEGVRGAVPVGPRRIWTLAEGLRLECGTHLTPVDVAYETWGTLNAAGDNAVLICHALTGDSHAAGKYSAEETRLGWWDPLVGPGRAFDTDRHFVVCANVLGGCQGTTGPASTNPSTAQPYGSSFPQVTVRDIVRLQYALLRGLGVRRLAVVAGGSLGGMQVLEWMVMYPDFVDAAIPIGASMEHTAQGIAYNLVGREAIMLDPAWQHGDYYSTGHVPERGLSIARMVGMITYQSVESMRRKFHRERVDDDPEAYHRPDSRFQVESYLYYQGESLVKRFDANSYLVLSRAMDLHDLGYGRGGIDEALRKVSHKTRTLVIGISSDILFPTHLQKETAERLTAHGRHAEYTEIVSPWGHDAFLIEYDQLTEAIGRFLEKGTQAVTGCNAAATSSDYRFQDNSLGGL
ncbi:MAG: homoserine O-acetyltransferase [Chloroflexota bacterium]